MKKFQDRRFEKHGLVFAAFDACAGGVTEETPGTICRRVEVASVGEQDYKITIHDRHIPESLLERAFNRFRPTHVSVVPVTDGNHKSVFAEDEVAPVLDNLHNFWTRDDGWVSTSLIVT